MISMLKSRKINICSKKPKDSSFSTKNNNNKPSNYNIKSKPDKMHAKSKPGQNINIFTTKNDNNCSKKDKNLSKRKNKAWNN